MKNKVELIGWYGGDKAIARAAWTSTQIDIDLKSDEQIGDLIVNKLWNNGTGKPHKTPFERGIVEFNITCDQASHIHLLKHRLANINGECLEKDTLIYFEDKLGKVNRKITVKKLYDKFTKGRSHQNTQKDLEYSQKRIKNLRVRVLNEDTNEFEYSHIKDVWKTESKKIFKITLADGKHIMCSDAHPFLTSTGYKSLKEGLSKDDKLGCNGITINVPNKSWTFKSFFDGSENFTRKEFATKNNISYELAKKWGYIFDIVFKKDENKDFKLGNKSWNTGKAGTYSIDIKDRKHNPPKGDKSNFWRGGTSTERESIGAWTTLNSTKVHKKYNWTCQKCGNYPCKDLHAHHIVPVSQDISKSKDFDNLISVCKNCHHDIHKSIKNELDFANSVLDVGYIPIDNMKRTSSKYLHFVDIVNIEFIKEEECYDIEISGKYKNFVANGIVTHNSARYKELKEDKFYLPEDWKGILLSQESLAQSNGIYAPNATWLTALEDYTNLGNKLYHRCLEDLTPVLGRKRAKESSRFFKTMNSQITLSVMMNMSCFQNFVTLRRDDAAQKEIHEIADMMVDAVKNIEGNPFKHTIAAFNL
jgi:thymidylate synthase (FAD)